MVQLTKQLEALVLISRATGAINYSGFTMKAKDDDDGGDVRDRMKVGDVVEERGSTLSVCAHECVEEDRVIKVNKGK